MNIKDLPEAPHDDWCYCAKCISKTTLDIKICDECFQTYEDCECTEDDGTPIR